MTISLNTLETLCNGVSDAVIGVDADARVCLVNAAAEAALGVEAGSLLGRRLDDHPTTHPLLPLFSPAAEPQPVILAGSIPYQARVMDAPGVGTVAILSKNQPAKSQLPEAMHEIVHELKVPISTAKSLMDLVEALGGLNEKQMGFIDRARRSLESMVSLVHELLDVVWMEADEDLRQTAFDFADLTRHAAGQFDGYARYQNIDLILDLPPDGCTVEGDERRLEGAIRNLLSNAIKYSPGGGTVRITLEPQPDTMTFRVEDHGLGIAPEHIPHIFDRFYRVRTRETRRIEGSGLGLEIVKAVIEKHRGLVFVESTPGEGSVFGFTLPLPNHRHPPA